MELITSDRKFIDFWGMALSWVGTIFMIFGLSCKMIHWAYCDVEIVRIFGERNIRPDLTALVFPLAMLIIGVALRLYVPLGWVIATFMAVMLSLFFSMLSFRLISIVFFYGGTLVINQNIFAYDSILESMLVNICLMLLCSLGSFFLLLKKTRSFYWISSSNR